MTAAAPPSVAWKTRPHIVHCDRSRHNVMPGGEFVVDGGLIVCRACHEGRGPLLPPPTARKEGP